MKLLQHITSKLLIATLSLTIGFGSAAQAMSNECAGGHCDDHVHASAPAHHADHGAGVGIAGAQHDPDNGTHDGCNPILCNALALTLEHPEVSFDESETVVGWHVGHISTHEGPDGPDRPPNL